MREKITPVDPDGVPLNQTPDTSTCFGSFYRTKARAVPYTIVGFDSEDNGKGVPISFAFWDGTKSFYTKHAQEALAYIYDYPETAVFVAHNLEYDIGNLFKHCDFKFVDTMIESGKLLKVTLKFSKNFFINSSAFMAGKLERMGKIIGVPKLDGDVFSPQYVKTDAKIPQIFMTRLQQRLNEKWGVKLGITIGQTAMSIYRTHYMKENKQVTYNSPNCLNAYYGGRVEIFYKGVLEGPITVSDINSCYPTVMRDYQYPDPAFMQPSKLATHKYGIGHFKVYVPPDTFIPPLPYRSATGRLFFPVGAFEGWWTYHEISYAMETVPGFAVLKEYSGEGSHYGCSPFKEYINDLYTERKKWKDILAGDKNNVEAKFESELLKGFMNNLYGKWNQHKNRTLITRYRLSKNEQTEIKAVKEDILGCFFRYELASDLPATANFIWGTYVTSYARTYLMAGMQKVHNAGNNLLYCDTDSIMYAGDKHVLDIGSSLGQYDREVFDLAVFRQAKGYLLCNRDQTGETKDFIIEKAACKGVHTEHSLDFIISGMAVSQKPMRLKEALVRTNAKVNKNKSVEFLKDIGVNVWRDVKKEMKSLYIKRKGDATGPTYPVTLREMSILEKVCGMDTPRSIEVDLKDMGINIRQQVRKPNVFSNIVIPPNWFKTRKKTSGEENYYADRHLKWLRKEELCSLHPDDTWFRATVLSVENGKYGAYLKLRLHEYHGSVIMSKNLYAALDTKFLPNFHKIRNTLVKKVLEITLNDYYTLTKPLELTVDITNPSKKKDKKCRKKSQKPKKAKPSRSSGKSPSKPLAAPKLPSKRLFPRTRKASMTLRSSTAQ